MAHLPVQWTDVLSLKVQSLLNWETRIVLGSDQQDVNIPSMGVSFALTHSLRIRKPSYSISTVVKCCVSPAIIIIELKDSSICLQC